MHDTKNILQSKTVWGSLITIAAMVGQIFGIDLGDTDGLANSITALVGAILAFYGRVKAVKRLEIAPR